MSSVLPPDSHLNPDLNLNGAFLRDLDQDLARPENEEQAPVFRRTQLQPSPSATILHAQRPDSPPPSRSAGPLARRPGVELILDDDNILPFDFLRTGDRLGRAVVLLRRADGASGTGFLVAPDILLTNHHVLPDPDAASATRATANYEASPPDDGLVIDVPLDPGGLFVTNADLDFTFCAVKGVERLGVVPLNRNSLNILHTEPVNIIQHPRGGFKQVALQDNKVVRADNVVVHYTCDTQPGSSGSPVFNNQWSLVALHHASVPTDSPDGRRSHDSPDPSSRFLNEGIRLSAIAAYLETVEPQTAQQAEALARLRSIYRGMDPQVGFFGVLGRRHRGRTAAEAVVESYRAGLDDLDIGYWDFGGSARTPRDHLRDLARIVAEMGMDVWCLAGILTDEAIGLVRRLDEEYRLDFEPVVLPSGRKPGLAVICRRSRTLGVERRSWNDPRFGLTPPVRLVLRNRVRRGSPVTLGLVPITADTPADLVPRILDAIACEIVGGDSATDWVLIGQAALPINQVGPVLTPCSQGSRIHGAEARVVADGDDGAFLLVSGRQSRVELVFTSSNLVASGPGTSVHATTTDREPPTLPGVWHNLLAARLVLSEDPGPTAPTPEPNPETAATQPGPDDPRLDAIQDRIERILREAIRPIVAQLLDELRQPPREPGPG